MNRWHTLAPMALGMITAAPAVAQSVTTTFQDGTFTDAAWLSPEVAFRDDNSFQATPSRQTSGGAAPDTNNGFVRVTHDSDPGNDTAVFFYSRPDWVVDPGDAEITGISGSMKWKSISVPDWGAGFGFEQDGVVYAWTRFGDSEDWVTETLTVDLENFGGFKLKQGFSINDDALPPPDFSDTGAPIRFGTITFNQGLNTLPKTGGFDDIRWDITVVPAPGAAAVLGLGGLIAARRRRA